MSVLVRRGKSVITTRLVPGTKCNNKYIFLLVETLLFSPRSRARTREKHNCCLIYSNAKRVPNLLLLRTSCGSSKGESDRLLNTHTRHSSVSSTTHPYYMALPPGKIVFMCPFDETPHAQDIIPPYLGLYLSPLVFPSLVSFSSVFVRSTNRHNNKKYSEHPTIRAAPLVKL